ncbi:PREDICTED: uncharacterized protein LOC109230155 [Nicotiana attenuata]|uniref:uncharacterized protein LOC109230155 n=1 Tax=Nicotiana attenuata TaxID=49451 RepID=UPI00090569E9|nr:PREDICTED: uncharacterized protein LOC109230155 [Nicotiana attenuata]
MYVEKKKKEENSRREEPKESKHMHALPLPQKLSREKLDKQFERFLDVLKQRKIEKTSMVKLTEYGNAMLQNKLPQKCGDPGSFTIPCSLGTINFDKSLRDSSASINLMPLSIYKKLEKEIGEIRSAPIPLQLADLTTITPEGIIEDVLVWVDKFVFLVDFIVVNMEENKEVPLILGRPFLATGRAILDIQERKLMLRVGEEIVTIKMDGAKGAQKDKLGAIVEWKVKDSKKKVAVSEKDKCGVYPKKDEKKLSALMCTLVQARGMEPDFDSDPD